MSRNHGILLGLLAVQVGLAALMWSGSGPDAAGGSENRRAFDFDAAQISELRIVGEPKEDGSESDHVALVRRDDAWAVASADDYPADAAKAEKLAEQFSAMKIGRAIASRPSNHEALGVGETSYSRRATIVTEDAEHDILLGRGARQSSHVRLDGGDEVYATREVGVWNAVANARSYLDVSYVEVDRTAAVSVTVKNAHGTLNFSKPDGGWRLAELGPDVEQDASAIGAVINSLTRVSVYAPVGRELKPDYGLDGGTEVTVAWIDEDDVAKSIRYVIGTAADEHSYYAKSDDHSHVVTIAKRTAEQATTKKSADFVKKPVPAAATPQ
jgi:hypothetical protein